MITQLQRTYAEARMAGNAKKTSALMAGCAEKAASQSATKLEGHKKVREYWERKGWTPPVSEKMGPKKPPSQKPEKGKIKPPPPRSAEEVERMAERPLPEPVNTDYKDPRKFMEDMMNDGGEDPKLRLEAAKALAQYTLTKPLPKKEDAKGDAAKAAAKRFGSIAPPHLKAVK